MKQKCTLYNDHCLLFLLFVNISEMEARSLWQNMTYFTLHIKFYIRMVYLQGSAVSPGESSQSRTMPATLLLLCSAAPPAIWWSWSPEPSRLQGFPSRSRLPWLDQAPERNTIVLSTLGTPSAFTNSFQNRRHQQTSGPVQTALGHSMTHLRRRRLHLTLLLLILLVSPWINNQLLAPPGKNKCLPLENLQAQRAVDTNITDVGATNPLMISLLSPRM